MKADNNSVVDALSLYIGTLPEAARLQVQQDLSSFARWCGRDRRLADLTPSEVGQYAEETASSGTMPDATRRLESLRSFLTFARGHGLVEKNLAQHARFHKPKTRVQMGFKGETPAEVHMTSEGYEGLKAQLQLLKKEEVHLAEMIRLAAADKDVRENAPLEAAREQQGHLKSRVREMEATLNSAVVPNRGKQAGGSTVSLGSWVRLKDLATGEQIRYRLVSPTEADPLDGKISSASPVGKALLNRATGQEVAVVTPRGTQRYLILEVSV